MGNMLFLFWEIFWSKTFLPLTPNARSLKDESVVNIFMTTFCKLESNPDLQTATNACCYICDVLVSCNNLT